MVSCIGCAVLQATSKEWQYYKCSGKEQRRGRHSSHHDFSFEDLTEVEERKLWGGEDWIASVRNTHMVLFVSVEAAVQTL